MKNFKLTLCVVLCTVLMASCSKAKFEMADQPPKQKDFSISFECSGQLYRATTDRRKDHKNCGCRECFGVCDVHFKLKFNFSRIGIDVTSPSKGKIYVLEDVAHAESEFGIDSDLSIPSQALTGTGLASLTLLKGEYTYTKKIETVYINGVARKSYGSVEIDLSYIED